MNLKQLQKQLGTNLRLRPMPKRIDGQGVRLENRDDFWQLEKILDTPSAIELKNIHSGHFMKLMPDNIKEYRSPDFLLLRCQVIVRPQTIEIEPIYDDSDTFVRLEHQIPALLAEIRVDLKDYPLRREVVLLSRAWIYWAIGNELVYYFEDHPELLAQFQVLVNNGCAREILHGKGDLKRYLITEPLAKFLGA